MTSPYASGQESQPAGEENLRLLEVWVNDEALSDELLTVYQRPHGIVVPLATLAHALDLALAMAPDRGVVEGFILSENRRFFLDVGRGEVTVEGKAKDYVPAWVERHQDDVYVSTRLIAQWLPIDLYVDLARSRLEVRAREPLPRMLRAERERRRQTARRAPAADYPLYEDGYRLATSPFIDQTVEVRQRRAPDGERTNEARYTTYATADFLFMESAWYFAGGGETPDEFRATLGRRHPEPSLLGPLGTREYMLGHISYPSMPLVARTLPPEPGVMVSSYPLFQQTQFDRHSFRGDLPPGWEIELYHNDVLLDIQRPGADGQYRFDDVPLLFGMNYFRLVFYGPLGQRREEELRFLFGETLTPPGELYYRASVNRDEEGNERTVAQTDIGLHRHLSMVAGMASLPLTDNVQHQYAKLGLRTSWRSLFLYADSVADEQGGHATELGLRTRIGGMNIGMSHADLNAYVSEEFPVAADPVVSRNRARLDTVIPLGFSVRLPFALEATRDTLASGSERTEIHQRLSSFVFGTTLTNSLFWHLNTDQEDVVDGSFQFSRRLGRYGVRGELFYAAQPDSEPRSGDILFEGPLGSDYHFRLGFNRLFASDRDRYSVAVNKSAGRFALGFDASRTTDGETTIGLTLFAGVGREPRTPQWHSSARPTAAGGAVSALVFTDSNQNGIKDIDENVIEGVGFTVNGSRQPVITDANGIAFIHHLPPNQHIDLGLALDSLEDPSWVPARSGARFLTRPGRAAQINFPVAVTGEIDGVARVQRRGSWRELQGVEVQLVDLQGRLVRTATTAYDGYYYFSAVLPGNYRLRIAPTDAARLGLGAYVKSVRIGAGGSMVSGVDLMPAQRDTPVVAKPSVTKPSPASATAARHPQPVIYTVKEGDWLWEISRRFYGDTNEVHRIIDANRNIITDPDLLEPGQKLIIPPRPHFADVREGEWVWEIVRRDPLLRSPFRHFE